MEYKETAAGFRVQVVVIRFNFTLENEMRKKFLLVITLYFWYTSSISFIKLLLTLSTLTLILLFSFLTQVLSSPLNLFLSCSVWGAVVSGENQMQYLLNSFSRWAVTHRSS